MSTYEKKKKYHKTESGNILVSQWTASETVEMASGNDLETELSAIVSGLDWKESVDTFEDIATTYPNPEDGWTVNVKDTDSTYRYNGENWIAISANAIPMASDTVDGKMSKEDYTKLSNLATVATSGSYDDLEDTPDLSVVADLTSGVKVATITVDDKNTNIYVPEGNDPSIDLKQAEYDALVESGQLQLNATYFITDGESKDKGSSIQSITKADYDALEDKSGAYFIEDESELPNASMIKYGDSNVADALDNKLDLNGGYVKDLTFQYVDINGGTTLANKASVTLTSAYTKKTGYNYATVPISWGWCDISSSAISGSNVSCTFLNRSGENHTPSARFLVIGYKI